jgi:hypothetical protein
MKTTKKSIGLAIAFVTLLIVALSGCSNPTTAEGNNNGLSHQSMGAIAAVDSEEPLNEPTNTTLQVHELSADNPADTPTHALPSADIQNESEPNEETTQITDGELLNIEPLLGGNFLEAKAMYPLGQSIGYDDVGMHTTHIFDTHLHISVEDNMILVVGVDYREVGNNVHFNGISGESVYADVVAMFGEPDDMREENPTQQGAVLSYGYFLCDDPQGGKFVRFYFDDTNGVVGIQLFFGARH